jgi:sortase (surface protein transpeptidase)
VRKTLVAVAVATAALLPGAAATAGTCWGTVAGIPVVHSVCVRQGTSSGILAVGAGHVLRSHPIWIAAHDVTPVGGRSYGPFHYINELRAGDIVTLLGYRYKVIVSKPIAAAAVSGFISRYRYTDLALTTCWPRYTMLQRWTVIARRLP